MYSFENYDDKMKCDLSLSGEAYRELIALCFRYSETFSFTLSSHSPVQIDSRFLMLREEHFPKPNLPGIHWFDFCRYYVCTPAAKEAFLALTDDLFAWTSCFPSTNLPDDPTFYRADGSLFFRAITHEGFCELYDRGETDVVRYAQRYNWRHVDQNKPVIGFQRPDRSLYP